MGSSQIGRRCNGSPGSAAAPFGSSKPSGQQSALGHLPWRSTASNSSATSSSNSSGSRRNSATLQ
eukprot:16452369-Heterocapsa_arctica.AAC.1